MAGRARRTSRRRTPPEVWQRAAAALRVLAHPQRLAIVERLLEEELTVGELAAALEIPPAACSQHLSLMRAHGLLAAGRRGRSVYYRVVDPAAVHVIRCIHRHAAGTERSSDRGNGEAVVRRARRGGKV